MNIDDAIRKRKSIRRFTDQQVDDATLAQVLEAARLAPSWKNLQCSRFVVVREPSMLQRIVEATSPGNQQWLGKAPLLILACADPDNSGHLNDQDYYLVDVAIAMDHLMLAAAGMGIGTCWIGVFDEQPIKSLLEIPAHIRIVGLTPLGYPQDSPDATRKTTRRDISELVSFEKYAF